MTKIRFIYLIALMLFSIALSAKPFTVVIDPGHGGKDPGAVGEKSEEKTINLNVALKLGQMITDAYSDVTVVYTRKTDKYVTLQERPNIANKANGDLFISIHTNASESKAAFGAETFTLGLSRSNANFEVAKRENSVLLLENDSETYQGFDPTSPDSYIMFEFMQSKYLDQSVELASYIQKELSSIGRTDRGVRQAIFWVLHQVKMPSLLVELGFITNLGEERFLITNDGQDKLATSIFNAFAKYKHEYDKRTIDNKQVVEQPKAKQSTTAEQPQNVQSKTEAKVEQKAEPAKTEVNNTTTETAKEEKKTAETPQPVETPKTSTTNTEKTTQPKSTIIYKVQAFSSRTEIPSTHNDYKRLNAFKPVTYIVENGWYKYMAGSTSSYEEIQTILSKIQVYFKDAFITAFENGKKIPVQDARAKQK